MFEFRRGFAAAGLVAVAVALSFVVDGAVAADEQHYKQREEAMKSMGGNMKKLAAAVAGGDMTRVAAIATEVSEIAGRIPSLFEEKEIPAESRAKPEIWDNFADFTAKAEALEAAATKVAADAGAGTLPQDPKAVAGMIGGACGGCHKEYRGPEK